MEHVPGRLNPADPLSRRGLPKPVPPGFMTVNGPAAPASSDSLPGVPMVDSPMQGPPAFTPLAGARVRLLTGDVTVPTNPTQPELHFLDPDFVTVWQQAVTTDPFFAPIFKGAAATVGGMVDRKGQRVSLQAARPAARRPPWFGASRFGRGKHAT